MLTAVKNTVVAGLHSLLPGGAVGRSSTSASKDLFPLLLRIAALRFDSER